MEKFLSEWYGVLAFVLFDVVALTAVVCITYRWFFKRILDLLVSALCITLLSPIYLWIYLRAKKALKNGEIQDYFSRTPYVGKKGKIVELRLFDGGETDYGKWLVKTKFFALARLLDVFAGRLSFIGYKPLTEQECETLSDVDYDRHLTRPGLINPHFVYGGEGEMLDSDKKYAWNYSFFGDVKIFLKWLLNKIRGQG